MSTQHTPGPVANLIVETDNKGGVRITFEPLDVFQLAGKHPLYLRPSHEAELLEKLQYAVEVLSAEGYDVAEIRAVIAKAGGSHA